ncbi:MAG: glycosyltransferase [Blautia massiliensis (ex Durand et al. 2017)]
MAAYNAEKDIVNCLDSLIRSNVLEKLDIIVVNDGSKDHTAEVVQKYVERYRDSIRLVNKKMEDMVQQSILVLNMLAESIIKF